MHGACGAALLCPLLCAHVTPLGRLAADCDLKLALRRSFYVRLVLFKKKKT